MIDKEIFDKYLDLLFEWNKKLNLTAIKTREEAMVRHIEDSLSLLSVFDLQCQKVVDVGTGGGFPGIPLKIARPAIKLTLVDSTRKKTEFLKHVVKALSLKDVEVLWGRGEELCRKAEYHKKFDIALSRAVGKLDGLL